MRQPRLSGLFGFTVIMSGQIISLVGTAMSSFALTIWAFELTGRTTALALVTFFSVTPLLVFSPIAGALVDRLNRKLMMVVSDLIAGAATICLLALSAAGALQIWHVYIAAAVMGFGQAFQWPAYSAAITTMMPKEQYGRANGMYALAETGSGLLAPVLAGALYAVIGLTGILAIDVATFIFAVLALLMVHVPQPTSTAEGLASRGSLLKESVYGFGYILKRPSLLGLQIIFLFGNFLGGISFIMIAPMILSRTNNNELLLGTVSSIAAVGGIVGGLAMSAWGGTRRKVHGVLAGWSLSGLFEAVFLGLGRGFPAWASGGFAAEMMNPWINSSNQSIWQAKVAPDVQGKVFSIRRMIAWISMPLAALVAGPLADRVMEPAMSQSSSRLAQVFGPWFGAGPGAGMALIIFFCGLGMIFVGLGGYLVPAIREAETRMLDYESPIETGEAAAEGGVNPAPSPAD